MQLKKLMIEVMVFFVLGCFLCACGKTKDQTRKTTKDANKEIMIGGDNYPPFNYTDENGNMAGIDVEFAREAFHRMGYKPVFVNIDWENKKNLVEQGKIDCIWACFSVTGRENDYHWAGPYMLSRQVIAVNDSSKINKLSALKAKYRILDEDILETGIGVAFAKNDKRGIEKELSKTLKAMVKDGSAKKILQKYVPDAEKYLEVNSL